MGPNTGRGPRLYHTKSRTGCARCRARRVKCNEARPICGNCERHGVDCEYDRPPDYNPYSNGARSSSAARDKHGKFKKADTSTPSPQSNRSCSQSLSQSQSQSQSHAHSIGCVGSATSASPQSQPPPPFINPHTRHSNAPLLPKDLSTVYWEMSALHHFTVSTCRTLPGAHHSEVLRCWSVDIPRLALEHEPLLNQLIATTCQHMITVDYGLEGKEVPAGLAECRDRFYEAALQSHLQSLSEPWTDLDHVADAMCFTASLLLVDAMAAMKKRPLFETPPPPQTALQAPNPVVSAASSPFASSWTSPASSFSASPAQSHSHLHAHSYSHSHPQSHSQICHSPPLLVAKSSSATSPATNTTPSLVNYGATYLPPVQWLRMTRGTMTVFQTVTNHFQSKNIESAILSTVVKSARDFAMRPTFVNDENLGMFRYLLEGYDVRPIQDASELNENNDGDAMRITVCYIGALCRAVSDGLPVCEFVRRITAFPCLVPPRFGEMTIEHNPQALLVLAHFFALATHAQGVWYMSEMPRRECLAIQRFLPEHMQPLMEWPLQTLEQTQGIPIGTARVDVGVGSPEAGL
ncbi:c6 zinc finger domain protein [Ophiostoma piceae UAMH 11346]|uniref:C6 zinc finger domain protein n=1 Tax=Ophiostoma piceae (strain UAMH 11346) TaxID=1262450 RepID=S3C5J1_OPHP1|nr:c6 zinc finger domain protein [Ophiostoma piceae UAMH 11346]